MEKRIGYNKRYTNSNLYNMKLTQNKKAIIEQNVTELLKECTITDIPDMQWCNIPLAKVKVVEYIVQLLETQKQRKY